MPVVIEPDQQDEELEEEQQQQPQTQTSQQGGVSRYVVDEAKQRAQAATGQAIKKGSQAALQAGKQLALAAVRSLAAGAAAAGWPVVVGIALVLLVFFVIVIIALGDVRNTGTRPIQAATAEDQIVTQSLAARTGAGNAINAFLKNPSVFNANAVVASFKKVLEFKNDLANQNDLTPKIEGLIPLLETWADTSQDQQKIVFRKLKNLRSSLFTGCDLSLTDAQLLTKVAMDPVDKVGMTTGRTRNIKEEVVNLDQRIPCLLVFLTKNGFAINALVVAHDHSYLTSKGNVSPHAKGVAMDIFGINGVIHPRYAKRGQPDDRPSNEHLDDSFTAQACQLMKFLRSNYTTIKSIGLEPSQIFGPQPCSNEAGYNSKYGRALGFENRYLGGHNSHVHIGF